MRRMVAAAAFALFGWHAALAGDLPPPVCARPAVLERVGELLRQAGRPMALEPVPIGEVSTGPGRLVSCAVRGHVLAYDTNRYAMLPVEQRRVIRYTLELRRNGIFVRVQ